MRICSKCLEVFYQSNYLFCPFDGLKTFNTGTIESEEAEKRLCRERRYK
jgi:hypothetical protein